MLGVADKEIYGVHCRIGSLEFGFVLAVQFAPVHCRIGSLEFERDPFARHVIVHCRIGSLELRILGVEAAEIRSLPHRQLRIL